MRNNGQEEAEGGKMGREKGGVGKFVGDNETEGTHTGGRIAKARFECQTSGLAGLMRVERRSWLNPNPPNRYVRLSALVKCPAERAVRRPSARIRSRRAPAAPPNFVPLCLSELSSPLFVPAVPPSNDRRESVIQRVHARGLSRVRLMIYFQLEVPSSCVTRVPRTLHPR